jgi:hypothetical protein
MGALETIPLTVRTVFPFMATWKKNNIMVIPVTKIKKAEKKRNMYNQYI